MRRLASLIYKSFISTTKNSRHVLNNVSMHGHSLSLEQFVTVTSNGAPPGTHVLTIQCKYMMISYLNIFLIYSICS
jgi:hypothetical protein